MGWYLASRSATRLPIAAPPADCIVAVCFFGPIFISFKSNILSDVKDQIQYFSQEENVDGGGGCEGCLILIGTHMPGHRVAYQWNSLCREFRDWTRQQTTTRPCTAGLEKKTEAGGIIKTGVYISLHLICHAANTFISYHHLSVACLVPYKLVFSPLHIFQRGEKSHPETYWFAYHSIHTVCFGSDNF